MTNNINSIDNQDKTPRLVSLLMRLKFLFFLIARGLLSILVAIFHGLVTIWLTIFSMIWKILKSISRVIWLIFLLVFHILEMILLVIFYSLKFIFVSIVSQCINLVLFLISNWIILLILAFFMVRYYLLKNSKNIGFFLFFRGEFERVFMQLSRLLFKEIRRSWLSLHGK